MSGTFATTNRSNLRFLKEVVGQWGATPSTGVTREQRMTSQSFSVKKNTVKSNELRADRMVSDIIETEMMSDGDVNFEFSAGAVDDLFEAFVQGTWTRPMTMDFWQGASVSWISTSKVAVVGPDITNYVTVGRRMKTEGYRNPNNNDFWQVSSVTYNSGAGQTEITMTATTATIEAGNHLSTLSDANDVIVLKSAAIRAGTAGASAFDSNGGNAFASAISAGQLVNGQKIHVEGLGYESGTVTFTAVAVAASSVSVNDGHHSYTFVAASDFAIGVSATASATNLAAAINAARVTGVTISGVLTRLNVKATSAVGAVTVTNLNAVGGALAEVVDTTSNIAVVNFSGGDVTQHGVFTIVSATDDELFVTPAPSTNANAGSLKVTVRGSMLRNPGVSSDIIPQSFSTEEFFEDIGHGFVQDGEMPSAVTLDVNSSAIITGSCAFMGRATTAISATVLGTSPYIVLDPVQTEIMNATTDVGSVTKNGVALTTAIKQIKLDGKAQLRNQMAISSKFPRGIGTGRLEISGSMQAYFETLELYSHFVNHDTVSLGWSMFDSRLVTYFVAVPAVKFSADPISARGIDQDVMEDIAFEAFRDPTTRCMVQFDRFSSLQPVLG